MSERRKKRPSKRIEQPTQVEQVPVPQGEQVDNGRTFRQFAYGLGFMGLAAYASSYNMHETALLSSYGRDFLGPVIAAQMGQFWSTAGRALNIPIPERLTRSSLPFITAALIYAGTYEGYQYYAQQEGVQQVKKDGRFDVGDLAAAGLGAVFARQMSNFINRSSGSTQKKKKS